MSPVTIIFSDSETFNTWPLFYHETAAEHVWIRMVDTLILQTNGQFLYVLNFVNKYSSKNSDKPFHRSILHTSY